MKRPPYARLLIERASDPRNRNQSHWILIGAESWDKGKVWAERPHRVFTVCPPESDPAQFDWSIYRKAPPPIGLVRCGNVNGDQLRALAEAVLRAGSPRIYDLSADTVYSRKPTRRAA
jgi:predicted nuclease of predicted toxin-antitoxin system